MRSLRIYVSTNADGLSGEHCLPQGGETSSSGATTLATCDGALLRGDAT